ncbi:MAG: ThiF family adenylyltransferase [Woeseiaceae bacterium]|nr:ThiF family adenylyltransferase [Woeseiaceae bacterium]
MAHDLARYHRQMLLPGFGEDGQRKLLGSTALVLGCGALGTVIADMLARAGVGHLVIVDRDFIELTNLQRQVLFDEQDVADAIPKAEAAKRKLSAINSPGNSHGDRRRRKPPQYRAICRGCRHHRRWRR